MESGEAEGTRAEGTDGDYGFDPPDVRVWGVEA